MLVERFKKQGYVRDTYLSVNSARMNIIHTFNE